jgi:hypothetical protein
VSANTEAIGLSIERQGRGFSMITKMRGEDREGPVGKIFEKQASNIPSDVFMWAAGASIVASLALKMAKRNHEALFVGQWAPTFLVLGLFNKLLKVAGNGQGESA